MHVEVCCVYMCKVVHASISVIEFLHYLKRHHSVTLSDSYAIVLKRTALSLLLSTKN